MHVKTKFIPHLRWISVEEKLPADGVEVLAWNNLEEYIFAYCKGNKWYYSDRELGREDEVCESQISAWMKLPHPWKEKCL